jgi:hypothetical protein
MKKELNNYKYNDIKMTQQIKLNQNWIIFC